MKALKTIPHFHFLAPLLILAAIVTAAQAQQDLPPEVVAYPDMVLYNGKVISGTDNFAITEAVAIRDGKFLAVGTTDRIRRMAGARTQQVDLNGRSVIPGLFDTHLHQAWVGQVMQTGIRVSLKDVKSSLEEVTRAVDKAKPGAWLFFSGPNNKVMINELNLTLLDPITRNNPIVIMGNPCNISVVNSLALKAIPPGTSGIIKDSAGQPTGVIAGFALGVLAYDFRPEPAVTEQSVQLQKQVLKRLNSEGLTTVIGRGQGLSVSILKEVWSRGELTTRVRVSHEFIRQNPNAEAYLKRVGNLTGFGDAMMKIHGTTVQPVDCTSASGAALTEIAKLRNPENSPYGPYGLNYWESFGSDRKTSEYNTIILANRYGWNITSMHAQGDKAATVILDAYTEANREKPLKGRWAFDHGLFRTAENMKRAKELGVTFSVAPKYLFQLPPDGLIYQYGADRVNGLSPVRNMINAGMRPVIESDIKGEYSSPLWNMEVLVTRNDGKGGRTWGGDQKITRQEALWMKTNWAAHYSGDEKTLGTIEPGKLADLVVLGGDYMTVPESRISELPIDLTVVGGNVVYDRNRDGMIKVPFWDSDTDTVNPLDRSISED